MYRFLAIVIGSAAFWWASGDWSCMLVFVVPACAVIDWFLEPVICGLNQKTTRRRNTIGLAFIAGLGLVSGYLLRVTPQWAFQEALAVDMPEGIDIKRIHRHYEGGPGEHTLIVEFKADEQSIQAVTRVMSDEENGNWNDMWRRTGGTWTAAWDLMGRLNVFPFSRWSWESITPIASNRMFEGKTSRGNTILLWEPGTQRGVMLQRRY